MLLKESKLRQLIRSIIQEADDDQDLINFLGEHEWIPTDDPNMHVSKYDKNKFFNIMWDAIVYTNDAGRYHRTDGPAVEYANGNKTYFVNGKLHRTDGPAVEFADGHKEYFVNGKLHRTDGPAVEYADGGKEYWVNGKLHRTDGPAVEDADGSKRYWVNGKLHRTDGPAVEYADGGKEYWVNGRHQSFENWKAEVAKL